MRNKVEGGELIPHSPYKVVDGSKHYHYTAIAEGSGDIEEFKTESAATWWLWMDSKIR